MDDFDMWDDEPRSSNNDSGFGTSPTPNGFGMQSDQNRMTGKNNAGFGTTQNDTFGLSDNFDATPRQALQEPMEQQPKGFTRICVTLGVLLGIGVLVFLFIHWYMGQDRTPQQNVEVNHPIVEEQNTNTNKYSDLEGTSTEMVKGSMVKVKEPLFTSTKVTTGTVSEKGILEVAGTDTYLPYVDLKVEENGSVTVTYFCNKDTYDSVKLGQNLKLYFNLDEQGKIVVNKLTDK